MAGHSVVGPALPNASPDSGAAATCRRRRHRRARQSCRESRSSGLIVASGVLLQRNPSRRHRRSQPTRRPTVAPLSPWTGLPVEVGASRPGAHHLPAGWLPSIECRNVKPLRRSLLRGVPMPFHLLARSHPHIIRVPTGAALGSSGQSGFRLLGRRPTPPE